jgi:hypothetical protein
MRGGREQRKEEEREMFWESGRKNEKFEIVTYF